MKRGTKTTGDAMELTQACPLRGFRVLVTRARGQAEQFATMLRARGAEVVELPVIRFSPPSDPEPLRRAIRNLPAYHWLVFTSTNGVKWFFEIGEQEGWPAGRLVDHPEIRVAAIGPATGEALEKRGVRVAVLPERLFQAEGLLDAFPVLPGERILIPRAEEARKVLGEELRARGARVDEVAAYRTVAGDPDEGGIRALLTGGVDVVTFTSSSTVKELMALLESRGEDPRKTFEGVAIACIGTITAAEVSRRGLKVSIMAGRATIPGLLDALVEYALALYGPGERDG